MKLQNYVAGRWVEGDGPGTALLNAVNGEVVAYATADGLDFPAMLDHARLVGGAGMFAGVMSILITARRENLKYGAW
jgi:hypothetical protein